MEKMWGGKSVSQIVQRFYAYCQDEGGLLESPVLLILKL